MPKKTKSSAKRGAAPGAKSKAETKPNKSAFVRSLAATLSASEVIARGKTKGIRLSAAQVYTIRANARRKGPKSGGRAPRSTGATGGTAAKRGGRAKSGRGVDAREAEFIAAALDLGLAKAEGLISALRSKAVAAMS